MLELGVRFWRKVDVKEPDECWLWKGGRSSGYGMFRMGSRMVTAHRISFEILHHRKPEGYILHKCNNKACVNPRHLYEGDQVNNARDLYKGDGGRRKLSNGDVREIRRVGRTGRFLQRELAAKFRCSQPNINRILNSQIYVHVK